LKKRKLKNVYGFSEPDLEANQQGELTARQIKRLLGQRIHNQTGTVSANASFRRVYTLERSKSEVE
jgi:hypothetical protein